jgi:hypothetical protein
MSKNSYDFLLWVMILLNFTKGLTGFRSFKFTRFYTRLIISAVQDISSFLFIFFYTILAFGLLLSVSSNTSSLFQVLSGSYNLILGDYDPNQNSTLEYSSFIIASIFNVIIMLSLLISILSDSFDKFQTESVDIDYKEMAEEIRNVELMFFFRKNLKGNMILHVCDEEKNSDSGEWQGKIRMIEKNNSKMLMEIRENTEGINRRMKQIEKSWEKKERDFETRMESFYAKIERIDRKIELQGSEISKLAIKPGKKK